MFQNIKIAVSPIASNLKILNFDSIASHCWRKNQLQAHYVMIFLKEQKSTNYKTASLSCYHWNEVCVFPIILQAWECLHLVRLTHQCASLFYPSQGANLAFIMLMSWRAARVSNQTQSPPHHKESTRANLSLLLRAKVLVLRARRSSLCSGLYLSI